IVDYWIVAHVALKGLQLELACAPPPMVRGQHAPKDSQPVIEVIRSGSCCDRLAQYGLQPCEVVESLRELFVSVVEDVFHLQRPVPHVDGERGAILAARQAQDMADGVSHLWRSRVAPQP